MIHYNESYTGDECWFVGVAGTTLQWLCSTNHCANSELSKVPPLLNIDLELGSRYHLVTLCFPVTPLSSILNRSLGSFITRH